MTWLSSTASSSTVLLEAQVVIGSWVTEHRGLSMQTLVVRGTARPGWVGGTARGAGTRGRLTQHLGHPWVVGLEGVGDVVELGAGGRRPGCPW